MRAAMNGGKLNSGSRSDKRKRLKGRGISNGKGSLTWMRSHSKGREGSAWKTYRRRSGICGRWVILEVARMLEEEDQHQNKQSVLDQADHTTLLRLFLVDHSLALLSNPQPIATFLNL